MKSPELLQVSLSSYISPNTLAEGVNIFVTKNPLALVRYKPLLQRTGHRMLCHTS